MSRRGGRCFSNCQAGSNLEQLINFPIDNIHSAPIIAVFLSSNDVLVPLINNSCYTTSIRIKSRHFFEVGKNDTLLEFQGETRENEDSVEDWDHFSIEMGPVDESTFEEPLLLRRQVESFNLL